MSTPLQTATFGTFRFFMVPVYPITDAVKPGETDVTLYFKSP